MYHQVGVRKVRFMSYGHSLMTIKEMNLLIFQNDIPDITF